MELGSVGFHWIYQQVYQVSVFPVLYTQKVAILLPISCTFYASKFSFKLPYHYSLRMSIFILQLDQTVTAYIFLFPNCRKSCSVHQQITLDIISLRNKCLLHVALYCFPCKIGSLPWCKNNGRHDFTFQTIQRGNIETLGLLFMLEFFRFLCKRLVTIRCLFWKENYCSTRLVLPYIFRIFLSP
jgi:hypothetical protein